MATLTSPRGSSPAGPNRSPSANRSPSLSGTPSSSVRTSTEIPRNGAARAASPVPPAAQRRNRAALRDYYNLKSKDSAQAAPGLQRTASVASNTSDSTVTSSINAVGTQPAPHGTKGDATPLTAQLDEPSFDADKYIQELLKTSTLRDVLRTESTLMSEIRTLDGERKALVYDNYSKLIKAVGTIGEMQRGIQQNNGVLANRAPAGGLNGVEVLETKLEELNKIVKELGPAPKEAGKNAVTTETTTITSRTNQRKEKSKQQALVRWVLDAPTRLEMLLEQGEDEQARTEWQRIRKLLHQWKGVAGVEEVQKTCALVMDSKDQSPENG